MWALVNPAYTSLFQCTDTRMWVNTLQCITLERETSYNRMMRKWVEVPNIFHDPYARISLEYGSEKITKR